MAPAVTLTVSFERGKHAGPSRVTAAARQGVGAVRRGVAAALRPHRTALTNLAHMPLTLAGLAGVDFAAFHVGHGWGWLAVGLSLIIAETAAADE